MACRLAARRLLPRACRRRRRAGATGAVAVPSAGEDAGSSSQAIPMGASYGSFKSTQNIGAFSGSLSRSLVRYRMSTPPPRMLAP